MHKPPHFWRSLLNLLLLLPLLFQVFLIAGFFGFILVYKGLDLKSDLLATVFVTVPLSAAFLFLCFRSGRHVVRRLARESTKTDDTTRLAFPGNRHFAVRYLPVLLAFAYTLLVALIAVFQPVPTERAIFGPASEIVVLAHLTSYLLPALALFMWVPSFWLYALPPLCIYSAYAGGLAWGHHEHRYPRTFRTGLTVTVALIVVALATLLWRTHAMRDGVIPGDRKAWYAEKTFNRNNQPFTAENDLIVVPDPQLQISGDHPKLDGATAVFPVYAAAAQAIYRNVDQRMGRDLVTTSTTPNAYDRLIAGEVDLIFVAQPSTEQRATAEAAGRPLQLTPIAREAFVFFVHADNPVTGLTSDQIRAIYTKRIVNWKDVGGHDETIIPFQRPQGSGSQTALEVKVMRGEPPAKPLREEIAQGMGGVIQRVATYQNSREALGYSFRVYATTMNRDQDVKFLAIDGVAPTRENIRSGAYPYTVDLYAATAGTTNRHVPDLLAWILGSQGQRLIDETGYVSLPPIE